MEERLTAMEARLTCLESRLLGVEEVLKLVHSQLQIIVASGGAIQSMSVVEAAGITGYKEWTLRQACNTRRIPESFKRQDGIWMIPSLIVLSIKEKGLPPQRPLQNPP